MSGTRKAQKGNPPLYDEEARWRKVEKQRNMDEEAPDVNRKGGTGAVKNPGEAGTQGRTTHPEGPREREEREE